MFYFLMDSRDLTIDGLIDTGHLSSAISEADLEQIKQIAPQETLKEGLPRDFQIMVANRRLKTSIAKTKLQFEVDDITFVEQFTVLSNLAKPLIGLLFLPRNGTVLDMWQGILNFPSFSMHLKDDNNSYPNIDEPLFNPHEIGLQPGKQTINRIKSQLYKEHEVLELYNRHNTLKLMKNSLSVRIKFLVKTTITWSKLVMFNIILTHKRATHITNSSIITPEQMK